MIRYKYNNQTYMSLHQLRQAIYSLENILYGDPKTQEEFDAIELLKGKVVVEEFDPLDDLTLEQLKDNCQIYMNNAFKEYRNSDKTYIDSSLGFPINANEVAYQNIDGCILQAQRGKATLSEDGRVVFTDFNDQVQMLNEEQLTQLKLEVSENGSRAYGIKWGYRQMIDSTEDKETLKNLIKNPIWDFRPTGQQSNNLTRSKEGE